MLVRIAFAGKSTEQLMRMARATFGPAGLCTSTKYLYWVNTTYKYNVHVYVCYAWVDHD